MGLRPERKMDLRELTMADLARVSGSTHKTIERRLRGLAPLRRDGRGIFYDPQKALPLILTNPEPDELYRERARLARVQAEALAIKNAEERSDLLDYDEVMKAWELGMVPHVQGVLRGLPAKMRRRVRKLTAQDERVLARMVEDALSELAGPGIPLRMRRE